MHHARTFHRIGPSVCAAASRQLSACRSLHRHIMEKHMGEKRRDDRSKQEKKEKKERERDKDKDA